MKTHAITLLLVTAIACNRGESARTDNTSDTTATGAVPPTSTFPDSTVYDTTLAVDSARAATSSPTRPPSNTAPRPPVPEPLSIPAPDTARGIVKVIGSVPTTSLVVARNDVPGEVLSLIGPARDLVRNVVGAEVKIIGRQTSDSDLMAAPGGAYRFIVDSFVVRASDGTPAHDGILELSDGKYSLRTGDGIRHPITVLPDALRPHVGSRIYIVGAVATPAAWGIIHPH